MNKPRILQLGWVLFLATLTALIASAFQLPTEKVGVADLARMMDESDFGKSVQDQFKAMKATREDVLSFIDQNRQMTTEQAIQLRDLSLRPSRSKEEQAQLDSLKAQIVAATKRWNELATKPNLTPEERTLEQDYADRAQKMNQLGTKWVSDFTSDMNTWLEKQKTESNRRARIAIQEVSKQQGYTLVLDGAFALYGANDLTDAAITAMNTSKTGG